MSCCKISYNPEGAMPIYPNNNHSVVGDKIVESIITLFDSWDVTDFAFLDV